MSTNVLLGYPQITVDATAIAASSTFNTLRPKENAIYGSRAELAQLNAADTTINIRFDLGSSQTKTIDFLYVARANLLKARGATRLLLEGSTNGVAYTDICGVDGGFQSLTLYGPRSEDAIFTGALGNSTDGTLPASPTYRYWKFWGAAAADPSEKYLFSKVMFGSFFDFGRDPLFDRQIDPIIKPWARRTPLKFTLRWKGITAAKKDSFVDTFIADSQLSKVERGVFLYTDTSHELLLNYRVVHCIITGYDPTPAAEGYFDLTVNFEEMI